MTFDEAFREAKYNGRKITRASVRGFAVWTPAGLVNSEGDYVVIGPNHDTNSDWRLVEEGHGFAWALEQLKAGYSVKRARVSSDKIGSWQMSILIINATNFNDGTNRFNLNDLNAKDWQRYY